MGELINVAIKTYEERLNQLDTQVRFHPTLETRILAKHLQDEVKKFLNVLYILKKQQENEKQRNQRNQKIND